MALTAMKSVKVTSSHIGILRSIRPCASTSQYPRVEFVIEFTTGKLKGTCAKDYCFANQISEKLIGKKVRLDYVKPPKYAEELYMCVAQ